LRDLRRFRGSLYPISTERRTALPQLLRMRVAVAHGLAHTLVAMPADSIASDEELMERYRDGDAGAFDLLYARHKGGVYRYMLRQCNDRGIAEELYQDVWTNLIRARAGYAVTAKFTTWLYRLAHNRLIDHYRACVRAAFRFRMTPTTGRCSTNSRRHAGPIRQSVSMSDSRPAGCCN
jgi:hypothetical protein